MAKCVPAELERVWGVRIGMGKGAFEEAVRGCNGKGVRGGV